MTSPSLSFPNPSPFYVILYNGRSDTPQSQYHPLISLSDLGDKHTGTDADCRRHSDQTHTHLIASTTCSLSLPRD
ncbi:hypothetical protein HanPI659440_Chr15g0611161 [Helianthus annuus]|nr:hypothetical protein HanPI659440_Chr15g0611161 [Helianthus annuus]